LDFILSLKSIHKIRIASIFLASGDLMINRIDDGEFLINNDGKKSNTNRKLAFS
jgi:hypothetical protein